MRTPDGALMKWGLLIALVACLAGIGRSASGETSDGTPYGQTRPYADLRARPYEYHGAKRDLAEPDVEEVRLGPFAPTRGRRAPGGLSLRRGAELAVAEANEAGGYRGKPFTLILRPDDHIWGSAREVVRLVYEDKVWAVIGSVGGESTHIAEQIVTKAQVPLISPASTDPSLTQVNIPWMFRCMPDDERLVRTLGEYLLREQAYRRVVGVAATTYDHRHRLAELEKVARRMGMPLALSLMYSPGETEFSQQIPLIEHSQAQAVVVWGAPEDAARLIRTMRERGMQQAIFGGPTVASRAFLQSAGASAEGVVAVAPWNWIRNEPRLRHFNRRFSERYGELPDSTAAYAYDATHLLIQAIRAAGLNRAKIRDALARMKPFSGVTGEIHFDGSGGNPGSPILLVARDGQFVPLADAPASSRPLHPVTPPESANECRSYPVRSP